MSPLTLPRMPIPRLRIEEAALLVIDVQDRLIPTIVDADRMIHNCGLLIRMAGELAIPYLVTEQYPKGLGRTVRAISAAMLDPSRRVEKTRFSACVDVVREQLTAWRRSSVLISGIEAHVCVLQTVLDLQASGWQCFVCSDAISSAKPEQISHALQRMQRAGAVVTGVMSAMYELVADSSKPAFGPCLSLAKSIR